MSNIIFYKTTADFDNTGEVLIYRNLLNFLRKYGSVIVDDSSAISPLFLVRIGLNDQERLSKQSSLSFMTFMVWKSFTTLFSNNKVWFVTGVGEHNVSGMKGVVKNLAASCFLFILRILGVKTFRIGMSMRFGGFWAGISERILSKTICYYYVRDSLSLDNCKKAGIHKCQLAPDLSWGGFYGERDKKPVDHHSVLLSFRDFCESTNNEPKYKKLLTNKILEVIEYFQNNDACEKIYLTYQCDSDLTYMQELSAICKSENIHLAKELITLDNAWKYYGNVD